MWNKDPLIIFATCLVLAAVGIGGGIAVGSLLFKGESKFNENWCPDETVTLTEIVTKKNYDGISLLPEDEKVVTAFKKLPFVKIYNAVNDRTYQGYVFNFPHDVDLTDLIDMQRKHTPLCVSHVRLGVFVLFDPLRLQ